ncbi:MAG: hypothetical protein KF809_17185 [Chloroflexi bacterium]|nr:hypothetical protein [Chloroflexota bacterium]
MSGTAEQARRSRAVAVARRACGQDIDRLAVWAARYALGRRTYAVSDVTDVLARHAADLSPRTRLAIVRDIDEAERDERLGDPCDAEAWRMLRLVLR